MLIGPVPKASPGLRKRRRATLKRRPIQGVEALRGRRVAPPKPLTILEGLFSGPPNLFLKGLKIISWVIILKEKILKLGYFLSFPDRPLTPPKGLG